ALHQRAVRVRPSIAEELPRVAHLSDHVEVDLVHQQLVLVVTRLRFDLPARIDDVAGAVELTHTTRPGLFLANAIDGADEDAVGGGRGRLLQLPEILAQARDRRRWIDDVFGAVQRQRPPAFREVPVVADVNAELDVSRLEHRVAQVARLEEELLVETRIHLRDVGLSILAQVLAVGVDDRGGVVVHAGHRFLVDRNDHHHAIFLRVLLHELCGVAIGNRFGRRVPFAILAGTKVRLREDFLEAQYLHARGARPVDERNVRLEHAVPDLLRTHGGLALQSHLDQPALEFAHPSSRRLTCFRPRIAHVWRRLRRGQPVPEYLPSDAQVEQVSGPRDIE